MGNDNPSQREWFQVDGPAIRPLNSRSDTWLFPGCIKKRGHWFRQVSGENSFLHFRELLIRKDQRCYCPRNREIVASRDIDDLMDTFADL